MNVERLLLNGHRNLADDDFVERVEDVRVLACCECERECGKALKVEQLAVNAANAFFCTVAVRYAKELKRVVRSTSDKQVVELEQRPVFFGGIDNALNQSGPLQVVNDDVGRPSGIRKVVVAKDKQALQHAVCFFWKCVLTRELKRRYRGRLRGELLDKVLRVPYGHLRIRIVFLFFWVLRFVLFLGFRF